jgi:hypothetical protein
VSAEVPKLQHRLALENSDPFEDRPPAEVVVMLADPAALSPLLRPPLAPAEPSLDDREMAFKAWHRFEYV